MLFWRDYLVDRHPCHGDPGAFWAVMVGGDLSDFCVPIVDADFGGQSANRTGEGALGR